MHVASYSIFSCACYPVAILKLHLYIQPPAIEMGNACEAPPTYNAAEMGSSDNYESDNRLFKKGYILRRCIIIDIWL